MQTANGMELDILGIGSVERLCVEPIGAFEAERLAEGSAPEERGVTRDVLDSVRQVRQAILQAARSDEAKPSFRHRSRGLSSHDVLDALVGGGARGLRDPVVREASVECADHTGRHQEAAADAVRVALHEEHRAPDAREDEMAQAAEEHRVSTQPFRALLLEPRLAQQVQACAARLLVGKSLLRLLFQGLSNARPLRLSHLLLAHLGSASTEKDDRQVEVDVLHVLVRIVRPLLELVQLLTDLHRIIPRLHARHAIELKVLLPLLIQPEVAAYLHLEIAKCEPIVRAELERVSLLAWLPTRPVCRCLAFSQLTLLFLRDR